MRSKSFVKLFSICLFSCFFAISSLRCQPTQRFFDDVPKKSENVRLTILNPTKGNIQTLVELRKLNILSVQDLTVIGLFHENQTRDRDVAKSFAEATKFVKENGHDWIEFHRLSGDLHPEMLFRKNHLSEELEQIFSYSDGIILFGGDDIPPAVYGEKTSLLTGIGTAYRSYIETSIVFHLLGGWQDENFEPYLESRKEFPILGLCLGSQSLNVGTGGTLFQDIPSEVYGKEYVEDIIAMPRETWHENPYADLLPEDFRAASMHRIALLAEGKFIRDWGFSKEDEPLVYSSHHQAAKKLGKGIEVIATSLDGKVVEAIAHGKYPNVLGVQFHPESLNIWDETRKSRSTPEDKIKTALAAALKNDPPSLAFHKKLWAWFSQKLKASQEYRTHK
jgi:putative glutamine amidotransferase